MRQVNLDVRWGEFAALVGPSGCGKTTLLRTIAGFLQPDSGEVQHDGRGRGLMVYQENSLFPWMTVMDNACIGLEILGLPRDERERKAMPLLERYGFRGRERAWPHQLSTGMKQRVAVIRSFLSDADLLLMDEPFASLDCDLRLQLQRELLELWEEDHKTVVFVTHDVEEALLLSDRVVVLSRQPGTVIAWHDVPFERPRHPSLTLTEEFLLLKRRVRRSLGDLVKEPAHAY